MLILGLFHKAIIQSGSAINPWSIGHTDINALSNLLNLSKPDERQLLEVLRSLPVQDLLKLQEKLRDVGHKVLPPNNNKLLTLIVAY